jgi:hypothetical protein
LKEQIPTRGLGSSTAQASDIWGKPGQSLQKKGNICLFDDFLVK